MRTLTALCTTVLILFSALLFAEVPSQINYQGSLFTSGGVPVPDSSYSVVFTIYSNSIGGSVLWTETKSVTTKAGFFTTNLGTGTPLTDAVFSDIPRFLGVKIATDPEISPRTQLVTSPYAFRLSTIDGAKGGAITGNLDIKSGNILKDDSLFIYVVGATNLFVGTDAGNPSASSNYNTAMGTSALNSITTGALNTAFGSSALRNNATGTGNTAVGFQSLQAVRTASFNTAIGGSALQNNTTGINNTATGYSALLHNTTGSGNTADGLNALLFNSSGLNNTATGWEALLNNTGGSNNTADGMEALFSNATGSLNTALGRQALTDNISGSNNTACGYNSLSNNNGGNNNAAFEWGALSGNSTGSQITALGFGANVSTDGFTNATAIGANALVNASNKIRLGDAGVTVIEGQVAYTFTSDRNQKENFEKVDGDEILKKIQNMNLASWNYKNNDPAHFRHYGPMAQEFFAAFGHDGVGQSGDSTTINSGDEAGILMIAVQALEKENERIKTEDNNSRAKLESTITAMQKEIEELKQTLKSKK